MDAGLAALRGPLAEAARPALWLVDENSDAEALAGIALRPGLEAVTNRHDLAEALVARGWAARFSDFDLDAWAAGTLAAVYLRVAKERALSHYLINAAARLLRPGGELALAGHNSEGIQTYLARAAALLGGAADLRKVGGGVRLGRIARGPGALGERLDDRDYTRLRVIAEAWGGPVYSKPGQFGWDKIDAGSALLAAQLPGHLLPGQRVLDLGCGYGYLSLAAAAGGAGEVWATDNNAAALIACRHNFQARGLAGRVLAADCGAGLAGGFDRVLCNPPFHQGFAVRSGLTERFVAAAARALTVRGEALFVVNRFIALERAAAGHFGAVESLAEDGSFRVLRLGAPRLSSTDRY